MYEYNCEIVRVVDGDTVDVNIDLGFNISTLKRIRIAGIDTPEVRGPERVAGLAVKEMVETFFPVGTKTVVRVDGRGKYGRWIGDIDMVGKPYTLGKYLLLWGLAKEVNYK